ncbi:retrovirus-related pol polyprotein from transposon TNT 1-94 [Tanacetum coccineum]
MFESRQATIPFPSRLNDYYCDEKKGSYGIQCLDAYSYGVIRIDDSLPRNYLNLGLGELAHTKLTVELANRTVKHPKRIAENVLVGIGKFVFPVDFIILDMPEDVKVSLILGRPFLSTAHAKIDVFKRKITLRRMELDLEARLMGETLVLKRSLDHLYGDYIKLNNLNVPLELRRNQVDDLMLTIEEGEDILKMEMEMEIPSVKASANSDVMYFFTSAQDGDPSQDDVRLCLGDDLKKAQDHSQRQAGDLP